MRDSASNQPYRATVGNFVYLAGHDGGQVGNGATPAPCEVGIACSAMIPAAASASQIERVSFFIEFLL